MRFARGLGKFFKMVQFGAVWSIFCCNFVPNIVKMLDPAPPPPWKKLFCYLFFLYFATFSLWESFSPCGDLCATFSTCGGPFLSLCEAFSELLPPPLNFLRAPMYIDMILLRTQPLGRSMGHAPPNILLKLYVWSILLFDKVSAFVKYS